MIENDVLRLDMSDPTNQGFARFGRKLADLLHRPNVEADPNAVSSLDDLLGAVYSLIMARDCEFADRPNKPIDVTAPQKRASKIRNGEVRLKGTWIAGWHFNSALFRIAAVYHRLLKVTVGQPTSRKYPSDLLSKAKASYQKWRGKNWSSDAVQGIYKEVNELKHSPKGIYSGRATTFPQALAAIDELLDLVEAWSVATRP